MANLDRFPQAVASCEELATIAREAQRHAVLRCRELETRMRSERRGALADAFAFLAGVGEARTQEIEGLATGVLRPGVGPVAVGVGNPFDDEAETNSRLLTPYRVLALAVRHAEQSFAFFTYVAAGAPDAETRRLAEDLAKVKLSEAWLVRRERRKAFHVERREREVHAAVRIPSTLPELDRMTARTEWHAAQYHRELSRALRASEPATAKIFSDAADDEESCARSAATRGGIDLAPEHVAGTTKYGALRLLEEAFERYTDIAERTKDEGILREAQALAQRAVFRFGLTRGVDERFAQ